MSELTISRQETEVLVALNYDIDVPCVVQWGLLWFSSPTRLNQRFVDNGTKAAKYNEVKDMEIEATFTLSFGGSHTPRTCPLRLASAVLYRSPEMKGWGHGERPVLLPYDDVSEDDLSDECRWKKFMKIVAHFVSSETMRVSMSPSSSSPRRKPISKVRKKHCSTQTSHDPKARRMVIEGLDRKI